MAKLINLNPLGGSIESGTVQGLLHDFRRVGEGKLLVTGWAMPKAEVGDQLTAPPFMNIAGFVGTVEIETIETRDHKGKFDKPEWAKDTYFEAICKRPENTLEG